MITGAAKRWSTGTSKKPWIWAAWRSMVRMRSVPAVDSEVGHELGRDGHARLVLAVLARVAVVGDARR